MLDGRGKSEVLNGSHCSEQTADAVYVLVRYLTPHTCRPDSVHWKGSCPNARTLGVTQQPKPPRRKTITYRIHIGHSN